MIFIGSSTLLCGDELAGMISIANPIFAQEVTFENSVIDEVYMENSIQMKPYVDTIVIDDFTKSNSTLDEEKFINAVNEKPNAYKFTYDGTNWHLGTSVVNLDVYGITLKSTYTPNYGDVLSVVYSREYTQIPPWGYDTVFNAKFQNNTSAGNMNWTLQTTNALLVKRRSVDNNGTWISIQYVPVSKIEDFFFTGYDYGATTGQYEYAIVPLNDRTEGGYTYVTTDVVVSKLTIIDSEDHYSTVVTDGACNTTYVVPSAPVETLYNKYPTIVANSSACYQTIEVNGSFYPDICNPNEGIWDDKNRILYMNRVLKMLTNNKPKILKNVDGRIWLVWITTPPSDSMMDIYKFRTISFGCTEIGSVESEKNLYETHFTNVPREFWNNLK